MDLKLKKDELLEERTACEQTKQDAHNRIIEINKTLKKLENLIAEADEILGSEKPPVVFGVIDYRNDIIEIPTDSEITQAINER